MKISKIVVIAIAIGLFSCAQPKNTAEEREFTYQEKLAGAYGLKAFDNLTSLHYTFNVKKGDAQASRTWTWEPRSGKVTLIEKGDTIMYNHNQVTEELKQVDHKFINDKYWLLFPFQLVWDTGYTSNITEQAISPISKEKLTKLTIQYNNEDGYTPGDAYDFYVDKNLEVKEWAFRKGGQEEPSLTTTWEGYSNVNGVKIASDHYSEDRSFRLWFTDVYMQ